MPEAIRDAIVPGAAAACSKMTRCAGRRARHARQLRPRHQRRRHDARNAARRARRQRHAVSDHLRYEARTSTARPKAGSPRSTTGIDGPVARGHRCRRSTRTPGSRCAVRARSDADRRSPAACRTTSSATNVAIRPRPTGSTHDSVSPHQGHPAGRLRLVVRRFRRVPRAAGRSIGYAVGAEYRRETSDSMPAPEIQEGSPGTGRRALGRQLRRQEVFAEINLPVLENARFADRLSFGAAFRASDYSTVGKTNSWKVDAVYAPVQFDDPARHLRAGGARAEHRRAVLAREHDVQFHHRSLRHQ